MTAQTAAANGNGNGNGRKCNAMHTQLQIRNYTAQGGSLPIADTVQGNCTERLRYCCRPNRHIDMTAAAAAVGIDNPLTTFAHIAN